MAEEAKASAAVAPTSVEPEKKPSKLEANADGLIDIDGFADSRVGSDYEKYQPSDGRTDRIAVLPSLTLITKENVTQIKPKVDAKLGRVIIRKEEVDGKQVDVKYFCGHIFKGAKVHYTENKGSFRCLGPGKICCQLAAKEPTLVIPVPVLKYQSNKEGDVRDIKDLSGLEWEVMLWVMNDQVYPRLRSTEKEFPLIAHDVKIKGKKQGKYVRIENVTPCAEALWSKLPPEKVEYLTNLAATIYDTKLGRFLGRKLSEEQIRELFGQGPSKPQAADASSGVQVDDMISGL